MKKNIVSLLAWVKSLLPTVSMGLSPAKQEGRKAFTDGDSLSDNPYPPKTVAHSDWREGFMTMFALKNLE